ncbi:MAG: PAS domain S-box protein [Cyanobacteria bacterium SZAS-4]|nr:PAS domain S-box protein [Cyanobacteria bacterium SZAS-4]
MSIRLSIWHKLLLLVLIPLVFEISFVLLLANLLQTAQQATDQYEQSKDVLLELNMAEGAIVHTMTKLVVSGSTDASRFDGVDQAVATVRKAAIMMQNSVVMVPELKDVTAPASDLFESAIRAVENARRDFLKGNPSNQQIANMRKTGLPLLLDFDQLSKNLLSAEKRLNTVGAPELERKRSSVVWLMVIGTLTSIFISIGAAWFFVNDILKRLRIVEENARLLAMRSTLKVHPMGDDELGRLDQSLHRAGRVLEDSRRKELAILDVAADVICSIDRRFKITAAGAASLHAWGYPAEDLLGRSILSLQSRDGEAAFRNALEEIAASQKSADLESQLICSDQTLKDFLWKINWSYENQSFYCVAHDISERRAADRMKQRFIAIVSHDLGTPLSSISATLSVLLAGVGTLSDAARKVLQKAEASLERLMDLIRDLLDLEKLEAGKVVLDMGAVSSLDVCSAACDSIEFLARSLSVNIVRNNIDTVVRGDERRLIRVLINLVSNAIKFSPRGSTVTVSVHDLGSATEISVTDQGPGIPERDRELIFEKFRQSSSQSNVKGTGLGLAIAKLIVEGHNGLIGVKSVLGEGSTFYIRIPNFDLGEAK